MAAVLAIFNSVLTILNKLQDLRDQYNDAYRLFAGISGSLTLMLEFMSARVNEHNDIPPKMLAHVQDNLQAVETAVGEVARIYNARMCGLPYGASFLFGAAYFGEFGSRRVLRTLGALDADLAADVRFLHLYVSANSAICLSQMSKQNVLSRLKDKRARDFWSMHMDSDDCVDAAALVQALAHVLPDRSPEVIRYAVTGVCDGADRVFVDTFGKALGEGGLEEWIEAAERGPALTCLSPAHTAAVTAASARGDLLATASADRTVKLFTLATGGAPALKHVFIGHTAPATAVAVTPDRRRVVSAGGGAILIWNTARGTRERALSTPAPVLALFASDERVMFTTARRGGDVTVASALTGDTLCEFIPHAAGCAAAVLLEGGARVMTWGRDGSVAWWDANTGARLNLSKKSAFLKHVPLAAWPLPGDAAAALLPDGEVVRWEAAGTPASLSARRTWGIHRRASEMSTDAAFVCHARGGKDLLAVRRTADAGRYAAEMRRPGAKSIHRMFVSADSEVLCAAADDAAEALYLGHADGSVTWHCVATGRRLGALTAGRRELVLQPRHRGVGGDAVPLLARASDGVLGASFLHGNKVLLALERGETARRVVPAPAGYTVSALAGGAGLLAVALQSADGRRPACLLVDCVSNPRAAEGAADQVFDIDALQPEDRVLALAHNPASGAFVALCACGPQTKVIQSATGGRSWSVVHEDATSQAPRALFAAAGCMLCPCDRALLVIRNTAHPVLLPNPPGGAVLAACPLEPRSGSVVTVHSDGAVRLWADTAFAGAGQPLFSSERPIHGLASDGASRLLLAGTDGCVQERRLHDGVADPPVTLVVNAGGAVAAVLDGGHLVTLGGDGLMARNALSDVKP
jgi:hypothetical protein